MDYQVSADEIVDSMLSSGLVESAHEVNIYHQYSLSGRTFNWLKDRLSSYKNVKFIPGKGFPEDYEFTTVSEIKKSADEDPEEFYALYLHHKGVTRPHVEAENDYRRLLLYFVVENWRECVQALDKGYDGAGVNWWNNAGAWHFAGNFWWAKSTYIKTLPELKLPHIHGRKKQWPDVGIYGDDWYRAEAETWIGLKAPRAYSIYNFPKDFAVGWTTIKPEEYKS